MDIVWHWPQYYFAGTIGFSIICYLFSFALLKDDQINLKLQYVITLIFLVFDVFVLRSGGFW